MATSGAQTVEEYLAGLPQDRREAISTVRRVILDNLPEGYDEVMQYGAISYVVPLKRYPRTYNGQPLAAVSLASQKNYMSLYLHCVYVDTEAEARLRDRYRASGRKLNMGKSCVRFKRLEDLPLDLIGEVVAGTPVDRLIQRYETARAAARP